MKNKLRKYPLFALCGLKCGLCPIHNMENGCPGCGGGLGHQPCKIFKCAQTKSDIEYCYECNEFPCNKYDNVTEFDSFILHKNVITDLYKAKEIGIDNYQEEMDKKINILKTLLANFNAGRKKSFYCLSVNLLDLEDINDIMKQLAKCDELLNIKAREEIAVNLFNEKARQRNIMLKLNKLKKEK